MNHHSHMYRHCIFADQFCPCWVCIPHWCLCKKFDRSGSDTCRYHMVCTMSHMTDPDTDPLDRHHIRIFLPTKCIYPVNTTYTQYSERVLLYTAPLDIHDRRFASYVADTDPRHSHDTHLEFQIYPLGSHYNRCNQSWLLVPDRNLDIRFHRAAIESGKFTSWAGFASALTYSVLISTLFAQGTLSNTVESRAISSFRTRKLLFVNY